MTEPHATPSPLPPPAAPPGSVPARGLRTIRRFRRARDGAVAVEFGIVAVPFFGLMFTIIETGLVFFAGQILETAVADSGRLVLTGQAQAGGLSRAQFTTALCNATPGMLDCAQIRFDMRPLASFGGAVPPVPMSGGDLDESGFQFNCGAPSEIIMLRAFYRYPVYTSILGPGLGNILSNSKRLLMGVSTWRNEPFGAGGCS